MEYLIPIKTYDQFLKVIKFVNEINDDSWEIFYTVEVIDYLYDEIPREMNDVVINRLVIQTIDENIKNFIQHKKTLKKIEDIFFRILTYLLFFTLFLCLLPIIIPL